MVLTWLVPNYIQLLRLSVRVYDASSHYFHYPLSTNKLLLEPDLRREKAFAEDVLVSFQRAIVKEIKGAALLRHGRSSAAVDSPHLHRINSGCRLPNSSLVASENNKAAGIIVLKWIFQSIF